MGQRGTLNFNLRDVFIVCGMCEIFRLFPSCHNGSSLSVLIITSTGYFCTPQIANMLGYVAIQTVHV